jgi:RecB family exonuclease
MIYLDGFYERQNGDIAFGHTLHGCLEKFHSQKKQTLEDLLDCYEDSWKNDGFTSAVESFEYYVRGKEILHKYFDTFTENNVEVVFVEKKFNSNIGKYPFIGIIDRVDKYPDGTFEVMDYKTHAQIWTQEQVDKDLQLSFYVYACRHALNINPGKVCIYFIAHNKKIYTTRTDEQLTEAIDFALETARKIENEEFEPNLQKCKICRLNEQCSHGRAQMEAGQ